MKNILFCFLTILIGSVVAKANSLSVTDNLMETPISNNLNDCDYPNIICPAIGYDILPSVKNPKSVKLLKLHLFVANCFGDRGVFRLWDLSPNRTLRFFYSVGTADGSTCSSTAVQMDVDVEVLFPHTEIFYLKQLNGKKTAIEYESYFDDNQELQIRNIKILPDQN